MTILSTDALRIKNRITELLDATKTFPYRSPLGSMHSAGIKKGEEIALAGLLNFIEEMEWRGNDPLST